MEIPAIFGDLLAKSVAKQGLSLGTQGASLILFGLLVTLMLYETFWKRPAGADPDTLV